MCAIHTSESGYLGCDSCNLRSVSFHFRLSETSMGRRSLLMRGSPPRISILLVKRNTGAATYSRFEPPLAGHHDQYLAETIPCCGRIERLAPTTMAGTCNPNERKR